MENNNNIVSVSEQAVMDSGEIDVELVTVDDFTPDDEKAVEDVEAESRLYQAAAEQGHFSRAIGMAQIKGICSDRLYAGIEIKKNGDRAVRLIQQLSDGSFTPNFVIDQANLVIVMRHARDIDNATKTVKTQLNKFMKEFTLDYYNKTSFSDIFNVKDILNAVVYSFDQLPVVFIEEEQIDARKFYIKVIDVLYQELPMIINDADKSRFILDDSAMEQLAEALGMTVKQLIGYLREFGFLYLTSTSVNNKTRIRTKYGLKWLYCIKRFSYLDNSDEDIEAREHVKLDDEGDLEF